MLSSITLANGSYQDGQQRQVERAQDARHVVALAEEVHRVAQPELRDERVQVAQVAVVVVAHRRAGEGDLADEQQVRVEAVAAQRRERPDRVVLALPGGDLGDLAKQGGARR